MSAQVAHLADEGLNTYIGCKRYNKECDNGEISSPLVDRNELSSTNDVSVSDGKHRLAMSIPSERRHLSNSCTTTSKAHSNDTGSKAVATSNDGNSGHQQCNTNQGDVAFAEDVLEVTTEGADSCEAQAVCNRQPWKCFCATQILCYILGVLYFHTFMMNGQEVESEWEKTNP